MWLTLLACVPVLTSPGGGEDSGGATWVAPENSWTINTPPAELEGSGYEVGEIPPDIRLADQFGDTVSLWQFYGMVIALDISTMWCGPCQDLAEGAQAIADEYRDQGFVYVSMFPEDVESQTPDQADLEFWSEYFGLVEPLLADVEGYSYDAVPDTSWPVVLLIDREMIIEERLAAPSDETLSDAIADML